MKDNVYTGKSEERKENLINACTKNKMKKYSKMKYKLKCLLSVGMHEVM